jgi:nitrate reductase NapAB chaperone NapD
MSRVTTSVVTMPETEVSGTLGSVGESAMIVVVIETRKNSHSTATVES